MIFSNPLTLSQIDNATFSDSDNMRDISGEIFSTPSRLVTPTNLSSTPSPADIHSYILPTDVSDNFKEFLMLLTSKIQRLEEENEHFKSLLSNTILNYQEIKESMKVNEASTNKIMKGLDTRIIQNEQYSQR